MVFDVNDSRLMKQWTKLACEGREKPTPKKDKPVLALVVSFILVLIGCGIIWVTISQF